MKYFKCSGRKSLFGSPTRQRGQGLVEYALLILLVGVASIALIAVFEEELREVFQDFIGDGEFAPPSLQPIGGEFATRVPSPTPQPQIINFSISPSSLIQIPPSETSTDISFDVEVVGSFDLFEIDVEQDGIFDFSWIPGQTPPTYNMAVGKRTIDLRATASNGNILIASRFVQVYNDASQLDDTPPIVEIAADVGIGQAPLTVNFTVTRLEFDADSSPNTYRWAMGNGYVEAGSGAPTTFTYTYTEAGTFRPILQVTDNEDFSGFSNELVIDVAPPDPANTPTPTPTNTPDPVCPYGPYDLPGTVQFQNFKCDGQGVSYNDTTSTNLGGAFRPGEGVDIYAFDDQGGQYIIGDVESGEWVKYNVNIPTTGQYDIRVRVASASEGNSFQVYLDGVAIAETAFIPDTGSGTSFVDIIVPQVTLVSGSNREMEFRFSGSASYNLFEVYPTQLSTACTTTFVEAETGLMYGSFVIGSDGAASGGRYMFVPNGGGNQFTASDTHRAEYCFNVTTAGTYKVIGWAYASGGSNNSFHVEIDGTAGTADAWEVFQNTVYASDYVNTNNGSGPDLEQFLTAGVHTLTVYLREDGTRLDKLQLELVTPANQDPTITNPGNQSNNTGDVVNLAITASDPDSDPLTFGATGLPPGLAINSSTGVIFGTPTTAGTYAVNVSVDDGNGGTDTASFSWTITSPPVTVTFYSVDSQDGWVRESGTSNQGGNVDTGGTIHVGDSRNNAGNNNEQRKGFISFDTSSIPDGATITSAQIRIRRDNDSWNPEDLGILFVDIASPSGFSSNLVLESTDFEAAAAYSGVSTLTFPVNNGDWSEGLLNATGRGAVNKTGSTQFRIYFSIADDNDNRNDYLEYFSGGASSGSRPELIITYTP